MWRPSIHAWITLTILPLLLKREEHQDWKRKDEGLLKLCILKNVERVKSLLGWSIAWTMQKYWCLWKDKCGSAHTCVLQWTPGKQISLTRHGNSHLLPLCFCVAKYLKNVLVFLSHRQSYTQEFYHATKVNTNKIWYGNTCGKDFQIKWRLHSHWLIHVASSFQNGSSLWSRQFVKVWKGVTFVAAVRSL